MLGKSPDGKYRKEEERREREREGGREMMCLSLVELKSVITLKKVQTVIDPFVQYTHTQLQYVYVYNIFLLFSL